MRKCPGNRLSRGYTRLAQAISQEEEAILWRSLERIPETYREPLILFYREHESVERVAQVLELSEEAVRQRLSRGRKMLHEEVAAFVEGALRPDRAGSGILRRRCSPPCRRSRARPGNCGVPGAKEGAAAAKSGFLATLMAPLAPFLGIAASVGAQCLIIRATTTDRRVRVRMMAQAIIFWVIVIESGLGWGKFPFQSLGYHFQWRQSDSLCREGRYFEVVLLLCHGHCDGFDGPAQSGLWRE